MGVLRIVSGGQTGADRAALDEAIELGIECGGWCPKGRTAEDGVIPERYPLRQTLSPGYRQRTEMNVRDSDGTLICHTGALTGGTLLTCDLAAAWSKPCLVLKLDDTDSVEASEKTSEWIAREEIEVLNVAGPRKSNSSEIYGLTRELLRKLFY